MYSRSHYKHPVFLYVSDDIEWGKLNLLPRTRTTQDLYFVGEGLPSAAYRWDWARNLKHSIVDFHFTVLGTTWPSCLWAITPSYLEEHFLIGWDFCQVEESFALNTSQSFESKVPRTKRSTMKTHWRQRALLLRLCSIIFNAWQTYVERKVAVLQWNHKVVTCRHEQ